MMVLFSLLSSTIQPSDHSIRAMCTSSYSEKLYMGTANFDSGARVLSYNAVGGSWENLNPPALFTCNHRMH